MNKSMHSICRLLTVLVALLCSVGASAEDYPTLTLDEAFTLEYFQFDHVWQFTAQKDGIHKIVCAEEDGFFGACLNVYASTDFSKSGIESFYYVPTQHYEFIAEAGKTYYIKNNNWTGENISAKVTLGEKFDFIGSQPENGGAFYITTNSSATLQFTTSSLTFTEGEVTAGGNVIKVYNFNDYNDLVASGIFTYTEVGLSGVVNWNGNLCGQANDGMGITVEFITDTGYEHYNVLNQLVEEGKLKAGDKISLSLHGVKNTLTDELYGGDGNIEVSWTLGAAPTTLVESKVPATVKSWYNPGDAEAVATLTFSKEIKSAHASLQVGEGEGYEDIYQETIDDDHITIDGKTVKVDLSGVMRTKKTMGLRYDWSTLTLQVYKVVDIDGNPTYSEGIGTDATYTFETKYKDITTDVSAEFTPATGSQITTDTKEVEIWFNNSDMITWDGVTFTYYTVEEVESTDFDGNPVVTAENVAHEVFVAKDQMKVETSGNETTLTVAVPDNLWKANNVRVAVNITGSVDGVEHVVAAYYNTTPSHDLDLVRVADPANGKTVSVLKEIYLTLGMTHAINPKQAKKVSVTGTETKFGCNGEIVDDGMMNVKIVLDQAITSPDTYNVSIPAEAVGDYVYGESGYKTGITNEACQLTYTVDGKYAGKSVTIDPEEGEVKKLDSFTLTFFEYSSVAPSWKAETQPYVMDAEGNKTIAQFQAKEDYTNTVTICLDTPIANEGAYTLVVPKGAVCNGANGDLIEEEFTFEYTVKPATVEAPIVTPEEGIVESLESIGLQFEQVVTPNADSWDVLEVAEDGTYNVYGGQLVQGMVPNVLVFNLYEPITKAGDYTFTINLNRVLGEDGAPLTGVYKYHYTIEGTGPTPPPAGGDPSITPDEGNVTSLHQFYITFNGYNSWSMTEEWPVIKDAEGNAVAQWGEMSMFTPEGQMLAFNEAVLTFEDTVTADGEYTLTVPVTLFDDNWASYDMKYDFHYVIGDPTYISGLVEAAGGKADIYDTAGRTVKRAADADFVKSLKPGMYIINGKKTIVR